MTRPLIGVTGGPEQAEGVPEERSVYAVAATYISALERAGAAVVLAPTVEAALESVDRLDALLLTGGPDIVPGRYTTDPIHPLARTSTRDNSEFALLSRALDVGLPVLGICRGLQMLAVHFGGSLHQHLPDALGHDGHSPGGAAAYHDVNVASGSLLASIVGERLWVNSQHHQGVADPGRLNVVATAPDGLIEALEDPASPFLLGVQWHPERSADDDALFQRLRDAAAAYQTRRHGLSAQRVPQPVIPIRTEGQMRGS